MRYAILVLLLVVSSLLHAEMNSSSALIIIDLQTGYYASKKTVSHIKNLIKQYKESNQYVLLVTFDGKGDVIPQIQEDLEGYPYQKTVVKKDDDGSQEIMAFFQEGAVFPSELRVVGINTCCCVFSTVEGLSKTIPTKTKVIVDPDGCHCHGHFDTYEAGDKIIKYNYSCEDKDKTFDLLSQLRNIQVLDSSKRMVTKKAVMKSAKFFPAKRY